MWGPEGELSGVRLGSSFSHRFSGRPFLHSCVGDMSSMSSKQSYKEETPYSPHEFTATKTFVASVRAELP